MENNIDYMELSKIKNNSLFKLEANSIKCGLTNPSDQARDFWNAIKDKNYDIMPCLDIETNNYNRSAFEITNRCLEFIQTFKELSNQNVMIYSGAYFARDNLDFRIKNQPLWIAHYGVSTPMSTVFMNVVGHQYTETGLISGVNGYVYVNNFSDGMLLENSNVVPPVVFSNSDSNSTSDDNIYSQLQSELNRQCFRDYNGNSLIVDGIPGELTHSACPLIRQGARGNITQWIQLRVGSDADGIFGTATRQAVIWFQESRGISADGIVGRNTWRKLLGM